MALATMAIGMGIRLVVPLALVLWGGTRLQAWDQRRTLQAL